MLIDERRPLSIGDIDNAFEALGEFKTRERKCVNCGFHMKIPIIATKSDIKEFHEIKQIIYDFIKDNPQIEQKMLRDLLDRILDNLAT